MGRTDSRSMGTLGPKRQGQGEWEGEGAHDMRVELGVELQVRLVELAIRAGAHAALGFPALEVRELRT